MLSTLKYIFTTLAAAVVINSVQAQSCNLSVTATPTGTSCSNLCDGSVVLTPTGGTAPYTLNAFDHSFPGTVVDGNIFNVATGLYSVSNNILTATPNSGVNTAYNNFISTIQTFPATGKIVAEASFFVESNTFGYFGLAQASGNLTAPLQVPVSFFFSNGSLFASNNGATTAIGGYSANTWYDIKIEKTGAAVNYYIRPTGVATYTLASTQTTTSNASSYRLAATFRNVFGSYGGFRSQNWRIGGNPPTTNLCAGTYSYTVYDAVGCFASTTVTIGAGTGPSSVQLNGSVTPASCSIASDGAIGLTPSGGTGPYSYGMAQNFSGNTINTATFELRNGNFSQNGELREGINTVSNTGWDNSIATRQTFSDGGYLNFEGSFNFDNNSEVAFGFAGNAPVSDVSSIVFGFKVANGGSNLFAFAGNAVPQSIGSINSGTYYDFKIEKIGPVVKFYTRTTGSSTYNLVYTTIYNTNVVEFKFGAVNFSNLSSSLGGYFTKNWSVMVTPKVTKLTPGLYTYTITDAAGCTATSIFTVGQQATSTVSLAASLVNPSIYNGATGAVSLAATGGTSPYKFQFEDSFSDSVINPGYFNIRNGAFVETTTLRSGSVNGSASWDNSISTTVSFADAGLLSFTGRFNFDNNTNAAFGFVTNSSVINDLTQLAIGFVVNGNNLLAKSGRNQTQNIGTIVSGTWYDLRLVKTGSSIAYFIKTASATSYTLLATLPYADALQNFKGALLINGNNGGLNTSDWAISANPPTTSLAPGTYSYTVYDANGCSAVASINVPAVGSPLPVVNAPANVTVNTNTGASFASGVNIGFPTFGSDTTGMGLVITNTGLTQYPFGVTTVTWTISNKWGESVSANQTVTVRDIEAPVISGISNLNVNTDLNAAFATVSLGTATVTDNVTSNIVATNNAPATFPVGSTTVTWTATDAAGNTTTRTQIVTVADAQLPSAIPPANVTVNTNTGVSFATGVNIGSPVVSDNVPTGLIVTNNAPTQYPFGVTNVLWTIKDAAGNTVTATQTVTVRDVESPVISGISNVSVNTNSGQSFATLTLNTPTVTDNVSSGTALVVTNNAPAQFPIGVTTVTWTARDASGNTRTATQLVTVVDNQLPTIVAPPALTVNAVDPTSSAIDPAILGTPTVSDNTTGLTITNDAPAVFPIGVTIVTWTVRDASGNTARATQTVTVLDKIAPTITVPANITINLTVGQTAAVGVNLGTPTVSDNHSPASGITVTNNAPASYPVGVTTVTWTAKDAAGNTKTATQTVTVIAATPVCTVPLSITSTLTSNTFTGGSSTNIYIGYGAQSTRLKVVLGGKLKDKDYTYSWAGSGVSRLSSATISQPYFTPNAAGSYTFTVTVRHKTTGCVGTASINICVRDVRATSNSGGCTNRHRSANDDDDDDDDDDYYQSWGYGSSMVYLCYYGTTYRVSTSLVPYLLRSGCLPSQVSLGICNQPCGSTSSRGTGNEEVLTQQMVDSKLTVLATPNPTTSNFTLRINGDNTTDNVSIKVTDALGRVVYRQTTTTGSMVRFGDSFTNGMYIVEVMQGTERKVIKLVKNN